MYTNMGQVDKHYELRQENSEKNMNYMQATHAH